MSDESLVKDILRWDSVLKARAEAGDRRAAEALERSPLHSPAWLDDRGPAAFPCPISDWCLTWPLGGNERGDDETVQAWSMRVLRGMGMDTMEAATWMREVYDRG